MRLIFALLLLLLLLLLFCSFMFMLYFGFKLNELKVRFLHLVFHLYLFKNRNIHFKLEIVFPRFDRLFIKLFWESLEIAFKLEVVLPSFRLIIKLFWKTLENKFWNIRVLTEIILRLIESEIQSFPWPAELRLL